MTSEEFQNSLFVRAQELADQQGERFGTEHLARLMDIDFAGPSYTETDTMDDKLDKLTERMIVYLDYDRVLASKGIPGNREIDAATLRLGVWDAHKKQICDELITDKIARRNALLSLMCKTNGLFLGREILNKDFTFFTHGPVFDFFVQKDPYKLEIGDQDLIHKIRLLMMPRGSFKSTCDSIDCVQWILVNPNIRIMFLTSSLKLAKAFVGEIKNYFTFNLFGAKATDLEKDIALTDAVDGPTPLQYLFTNDIRFERPKRGLQYPKLNFILNDEGDKKDSWGKKGKETEFICPARAKGDQRKKEVTIWAGSVSASNTGMHCDIMKADDAVDLKNTKTPKLIEDTNAKIGMLGRLVDGGGYKDYIGTPYAPNDWYGHTRNNVDNVMILCRPAKVLRRDINGATAIDRGFSWGNSDLPVHNEKDCKEADWTFLFPQNKNGRNVLTHKNLQMFQQESPESYPSQYMLDMSGYKKVSFTDELMSRQTLTRDQLPLGPFKHYIVWDLAEGLGQTNDYSVGVVVAVDMEGKAYLVEVIRDRFSIDQICYQVAKLNLDYKPIGVYIEDARGAKALEGDIRRKSQDLGVSNIPLRFIKVDNTKGAKSIRIGKLEPRLKDRMLFFLNTITCYQDLVSEFVNYGSAPHDDIPDAIALLCENALSPNRQSPIDPLAAEQAQKILENKAFNEMIFATSPEENLKPVVIEPLPGTEPGGTGNDSAGDLWDPFGAGGLRR